VLGIEPDRCIAFDEFSDVRSPTHFEFRSETLTLVLKGELELEFHDIEGAGGPGHDSPTDTKTLGTRSPFVEIDSFWMAPRLGLGDHVWMLSVLEFQPDGARVGAVWADAGFSGPAFVEHHLEAGYNAPFVKVDRRTERYPLIATAYWRESELHLCYEAALKLGQRLRVEAGLSLAMMRPLALVGVQESTSQSGTINIIGLGPARTFSGNGPVGGARLGVGISGAFLEVFGFLGRMAAEGGTDVLRSALPNYRYMESAGDPSRYGDFRWAGGRAGYSAHGAHVVFEAASSQEDILVRYGAYAQASYEFELPGPGGWLSTLEPLARVETMRILDGSRVQSDGHVLRSTAPANAASWDYDVLTLALLSQVYRDMLRLRVEYYFIREHNGVPDNGVADVPFANDELMLQMELRF